MGFLSSKSRLLLWHTSWEKTSVLMKVTSASVSYSLKRGQVKGHKHKYRFGQKFVKGCVNKKMTEEQANGLWSTFEYFSGYGFNKSHAVSYSILSFQCALLSTTTQQNGWLLSLTRSQTVGKKRLLALPSLWALKSSHLMLILLERSGKSVTMERL